MSNVVSSWVLTDKKGVVMARLSWNSAGERFFETGLDRGVLYPKSGSPVPWNGLISFEEGGGDGVTPYYLDGRPYLYLPSPKEFAGTLTAYTYPDEFAALIGFEEVADGMFADSQMGDQFNLSYRTAIGNDLDGVTHAYKIHLIYNAVATPSNRSYSTQSNSIEPLTMSFDIQAIPVRIQGYRPTAHVVLDSRKVDVDGLSDIEDILYGTDAANPSFPTAQAVYDLLSAG